MSGLIFIFIITLVVFAIHLAESSAKLKKAYDDIGSGREIADGIGTAIASEVGQTCKAPVWDPSAQVLHMPEEVIAFEIGDDQPRAESHACIGRLAVELVQNLRCHVSGLQLSAATIPGSKVAGADRLGWCGGPIVDPTATPCTGSTSRPVVETLLVEGHTDARIIQGGRFEDNLELSAARASAVLRMMLQCQPHLVALRNALGQQVVSVTGYADMRLAHPQDPLHDGNRRIDLRFVMELPQRPESHHENFDVGAGGLSP